MVASSYQFSGLLEVCSQADLSEINVRKKEANPINLLHFMTAIQIDFLEKVRQLPNWSEMEKTDLFQIIDGECPFLQSFITRARFVHLSEDLWVAMNCCYLMKKYFLEYSPNDNASFGIQHMLAIVVEMAKEMGLTIPGANNFPYGIQNRAEVLVKNLDPKYAIGEIKILLKIGFRQSYSFEESTMFLNQIKAAVLESPSRPSVNFQKQQIHEGHARACLMLLSDHSTQEQKRHLAFKMGRSTDEVSYTCDWMNNSASVSKRPTTMEGASTVASLLVVSLDNRVGKQHQTAQNVRIILKYVKSRGFEIDDIPRSMSTKLTEQTPQEDIRRINKELQTKLSKSVTQDQAKLSICVIAHANKKSYCCWRSILFLGAFLSTCFVALVPLPFSFAPQIAGVAPVISPAPQVFEKKALTRAEGLLTELDTPDDVGQRDIASSKHPPDLEKEDECAMSPVKEKDSATSMDIGLVADEEMSKEPSNEVHGTETGEDISGSSNYATNTDELKPNEGTSNMGMSDIEISKYMKNKVAAIVEQGGVEQQMELEDEETGKILANINKEEQQD